MPSNSSNIKSLKGWEYGGHIYLPSEITAISYKIQNIILQQDNIDDHYVGSPFLGNCLAKLTISKEWGLVC